MKSASSDCLNSTGSSSCKYLLRQLACLRFASALSDYSLVCKEVIFMHGFFFLVSNIIMESNPQA